MRVVNTEEWTNKIKEKFDGKKYFIYTLGCQLNENDSENSWYVKCSRYYKD